MFLVFFLSDRFVPFFFLGLGALHCASWTAKIQIKIRVLHLPDAGHFIVVPLGSISSFVAFFSKLVSLFCVNKC